MNPFKTYHPAVAFLFLASVIVLSMAFMHPVLMLISLLAALACSFVVRGHKATVSSFKWVIPMCVIVALANPLFSALGSTELFRIGLRAFYLESFIYGLCSGAMFASVLLWFASYSNCMDSESTLALFGNILPVVSLMVSQVLRLVPQFVKRGSAIAMVQDSNSAAAPKSAKEKVKGRYRIVSVLMAWGMEDGLERSDVMRARGYESGMKRSTYKRFRITFEEELLLFIILALFITSFICGRVTLQGFSFYPQITGVRIWLGIMPQILLMFMPVALYVKERMLWKRYR